MQYSNVPGASLEQSVYPATRQDLQETSFISESMPEQEREHEHQESAQRMSVESIVSSIWDGSDANDVNDVNDGNNEGSPSGTDSSRTSRSVDSNSGRGTRSVSSRWQTTLTPLTESPEGGVPRALPAHDPLPNNVRRNNTPVGTTTVPAGHLQRHSTDANVDIGMHEAPYRSEQLSPAALLVLEEAKASARTSFSVISEEAFNITAPVPMRSAGSASAPSGLSSNGSPPRMPSPPMLPPSPGQHSSKYETQSELPFPSAARQAMDVAIAGRMQGSMAGGDLVAATTPRTDSISPPVRSSGICAGEEPFSMRASISGLMTSPGRSSVLSMSAEDPDSARRSQRSPAISSQLSTRTAVEDGSKGSQPLDEERLRELFDYCDVDRAGVIDRLKLVRACRDNRAIAEALGLPQQIRQEDGSLDLLERIFQEMDADDNRVASWEEFRAFLQKQTTGASARATATADFRAHLLTQEAPMRRTTDQSAALIGPQVEAAQGNGVWIMEETARRWNAVAAEDVLLQQLKPHEQMQEQLPHERAPLKPQGEPEAEAAPGAGSPTASNVSQASGSPTMTDPMSAAQPNSAVRTEVAAARQQARIAEEVMAQANEEAQASQARARELDAQNSKLQRDLQAVKAQLEERRRDHVLQAEEQEASASRHLLDAAGRSETEAQRVAEATEALYKRSAELEQEAENLQADHDDAVDRLQQQDIVRLTQWSRLAALAALRRGTEPPEGTTMHELVSTVSRDWIEARNVNNWRRRHHQELEGRRELLQTELAAAQKALQSAASQHAGARRTLDSRQHECNKRERLADEELTAAKFEHSLLKDARLEWQRARPQLVGLLEELHAGNREGNGQTRDLSERLVMLRSALESNGFSMLRGGSPVSSEAVGPEDSISNITAHSESKGLDTSPGSTGDNEEDFLRPGGLRSSGGNIADDEALRRAVEESDLLHKKLLTLEDEKASLIREQEDLIQYIKGKVVPLQRALLVDA